MKTIAQSNIATRFGAVFALSLAGAVLAGAMTPAAAHKGGGGGGGHHGNHQPKQPQNPGPIGPLPRPQSQPLPKPVPPPVVRDHRTPKPVVIRDHRAPKPVVIRDHRETPAPIVRDKRATGSGGGVTVTESATQRPRGGTQCLGNLCGVGKTVKTAVGGAINSAKRTIGKGIKIAKSGKYPGGIPR